MNNLDIYNIVNIFIIRICNIYNSDIYSKGIYIMYYTYLLCYK